MQKQSQVDDFLTIGIDLRTPFVTAAYFKDG